MKRGAEPGKQPWEIVRADFIAGATTPEGLPAPTQAEVAFAGRSNVGKSSLINRLTSRKNLVRTSATPGCTRQVNVFAVAARDRVELALVDLPGYGFAKRSKSELGAWKKLIEGYLETRATLRAVVVIVDVRRGLEEDDVQLLEYVRSLARPSRRAPKAIVVTTKLDKVSRSEALGLLAKVRRESGEQVLGFSSETGQGAAELWQAIRDALHLSPPAN